MPAGRTAGRAPAACRSSTVTVSPDGAVSAGLGVDAVDGAADSGDLSVDLTELMVALGEAARDQGTGVVFLFDDVQSLTSRELEALIAAQHKTVHKALPVTLVGAGLPQIPRLAGEAKSYAERLFRFPEIGPLPGPDATDALVGPAQALGVEYEPDAAAKIVEISEGYPYFRQESGSIWDEAAAPRITVEDVEVIVPLVESKLDGSFFRVRAERTTELELQYLRAMAELGSDAQKASDVARIMHRTSEQLGPTRSRLIEKGLLYTPGYGLAAFTVPQFDRFKIRNHMLTVTPPVTRRQPERKR